MITAYSQVKKYCEEQNMPVGNRIDMEHIGRMIAAHFRRHWGVKQPAEIISQAGFVFSEEPGRPMLVVGYPDCFSDEMRGRIILYYQSKEAKKLEQQQKEAIKPEKVTKSVPARERKRIPYKPIHKKTWSEKPSNPNL